MFRISNRNAMPLVSIVLPTHNGERYLSQAIESCLEQTYPHWELILVDDGSTDRTPELVAGYAAKDRRISSVRHPHNRRLPAALNTGFARARGKYFTWTSDDNCYRPEALAHMVVFLEEHRGVDVVYTDATYIDENNRPLRLMVAQDPEVLAFSNPIGACFLYHRYVHEQLGGYDESLFLAEDYDFWLRASRSFKLQPLNRDLYLYRWHLGSLTLQQKAKAKLAAEEALRRNLPHMRWLGKGLIASAYLDLGRAARKRKDWRAVRGYVVKALQSSPTLVFRQACEMVTRRAVRRESTV